MDISIVIPVFNEERNLPVLYSGILKVFANTERDYEIIFVNDGSSDKSYQVLRELKSQDSRIRVISFDKNYGQTSALDAGIKNATGNFILTIDADLCYKPDDLIRILEELRNYDAVIGYRSNRRGADGYIKFMSSKIANYIRNKVLGENIKDAGCFLRGYRKECIADLKLYRGFQVFAMSLLSMNGYKIKQIEVKAYPRRYGKSKYNIRNRLFKELLALCIVKWMQHNKVKYRIQEK